MLAAVSQVSTLHSPFERDVEEYAAGACHVMEIWLTKLETYLQSHSLDQAIGLLARHEMQLPVASYQGGLLVGQEQARREHWEHFARRLALLRCLGVGTLVVAGDIAGPLGRPDLDRVAASLAEAARQASQAGVRLALEFQSQAALANNLETAVALVGQVGSPSLGICLDSFHFFTGPSKTEDLEYLHAGNLFHVQLSDLSGVPRELATDSDRILPGDGDLPIAALVARLGELGYQGCVSLEVMNPQLWRTPPRHLSELGMTALRRLLGQASMD